MTMDEEMRDFLTSILSAVELDPAESTVRLSYRIPLSGNSVASPGGFEPPYSP